MVTKTSKVSSTVKKTVPSTKSVKKETVKSDSTKKTSSSNASNKVVEKQAVKTKVPSGSTKKETLLEISKEKKTETKGILEKGTIQYCVMEFAKDNSLKFESTSQKGIVFEKFVAALLEADGYKIKVPETRSSGDHGVDMIVSKTKTISGDLWDERSTVNYIVQCKYKETGNVTPSQIRDLIGSCESMKRYQNRLPMFITTTDYTFDAKEAAKKGKVVMIDGNKLVKMYQKAKKKKLI